MFLLDTLLIGGLWFVLDKVAAVADQEMNDPERWREELLELQLRLEEGEIDPHTFAERERIILDRLRALHPGGVGVLADASALASIEVSIDPEDGDERGRR